MTIRSILPIFSSAFAVIYVLAVQMNWALLTYHPRLDEWELLTKPPKSGPAMYWYGWILTSTIGATVVSLAALPFRARLRSILWFGWAIPLFVLAAFIYLFREFFLR